MKDKDFQQWKDELQQNLVQLTMAAKAIKTADIPFLKSVQENSRALNIISDTLLATMNRTLEYSSLKGNVQIFDGIEDVEDRYEIAIDAIDNLFEKATFYLESTRPSSQKLKLNPEASFSTTEVRQKHIMRPQLRFKDTIDNSNTPWEPIIKYKPNAIKPLESAETLSPEMKNHLKNMSNVDATHPYEYEIQNLVYPAYLFEKSEPIVPTPLKDSTFTWVEKKETLLEMCAEFKKYRELAIDLEHHDFRSFQGFTCLIQISTRHKDYIIDALELRSELHALNETFTDPKIVKIFHGADMDIQWLQRDFGVYVVNLFDTYHASKVLEKEKFGFAYLLEHYCQVFTNKKYQLADWRVRPLSAEMLQYAQCDTHYLLYIYDLMKNELLDKMTENENPAIDEVLGRSSLTSLKKYEKLLYDHETGEGSGGWKNVIRKCNIPLNGSNIAVLRAVHAWRDHIARKEDESLRFVMPNHMLVNLCRFMPITSNDVIAGCSPTPTLVRLYAKEIATIIEQAMLSAKASESLQQSIEPKTEKRDTNVSTKANVKGIEGIHNRITTNFVNESKLFGHLLSVDVMIQAPVLSDINSDVFVTEANPVAEEEVVESVEEMEVEKQTDAMEVDPQPIPKKRKDGADILASLKVNAKKHRVVQQQEVDPDFKAFDYSKAEDIKKPTPVETNNRFDPMKKFMQDEIKAAKKQVVKRKPKSISYKK